eukprot:TRINITY_DN4249_c0_g2_i1.p1 TRINITY_DN4249_c0_g2~~TRINITY_DN4249_c0_g2_i1.p1  ORF type:complete len:304 (+),score=32.09 TRINITY_DN4249_c0_g2_i1:30-941(+)
MTEKPKDQILLRLVVGGLTGAIVKSSVAPIERMKILYETQTMLSGHQKLQYTGILKAFGQVWKRDGLFGFWKGNGISLMRIIPDAAIKFSSFDYYKRFVPQLFPNFSQTPHGFFLSSFVAGSLSGGSQVIITYPLDVMRTRIIVGGGKYTGLYHCLSTTFREEGIRAFYKGIIPSLLSVAFYVGVSLGIYDAVKTRILSPDSSVFLRLAVGAGGAVFASFFTFPFDVVRRRLQLQGSLHRPGPKMYDGAWHCATTIWKTEGIRGLYRGYSLQVLRSAPATALQFVTYDFFKKKLGIVDKPMKN